MTALPRLLALLIALAAFAALAIRIAVDLGQPGATPASVLWAMARFFTVLTTLLVGITFAGIAATGRVPPVWTAILTVAIVVVGVVYHLLLAGLLSFEGWGRVSDALFHTFVPVAVALWWAGFAPKAPLRWRDLPLFAAWPAIYVVYAFARAAADGVYPYPFLDIGERGVGPVAATCAAMLAAVLLSGAAMIGWGRWTGRGAVYSSPG